MMSHVRVIFLLLLLGTFAEAKFSGAGGDPDLAHHPVYSKYQFGGREAKVVDLSSQPLGVPIGVLGAVIGHDRLLRGALKERGWELRNHAFLKGPDANFFFQRGDLEVALAGDWPTLTMAATYDIQVIGLAKQGFSSIISKDLHQIVELKGKRIGSPPGSNAHLALLMALDRNGIKESEVTMVPMDVTKMVEALAQDKVDAINAWEPFSINALKTHPEFSLMQRSLDCSFIFLSGELVRKNPEIADLVVAAYVRALRWMRNDRKNLLRAVGWAMQDSTQLLGKATTFSSEELARSTTDNLLQIATSPGVPRQYLTENGSIRRAFTFLQGHGKIAAGIPWQKIAESFDATLTDKILTDPRKYQIFSFDYDH